MNLAALGDAGCDHYLDKGVWYPGGQALNVAVNALRSGAERAAYLGIFGDDARGETLRALAAKEGVDLSRCRTVCSPTPLWGVRIVDGDRFFEDSPFEGLDELVALHLSGTDLAYLEGFDVCHVTNEARLDAQLARLHCRTSVSYDFSVYAWDDAEWVRRVAPHVDVAFLSGEREDGSRLSERGIAAFARHLHGMGTQVVVCTLGSRGSLCSFGERLARAGIVEVEMSDAMGAGDSFAAAFLVSWFDSYDVEASLAFAAKRAAHTCTIGGAWGHPQVS